MHTQLDKTHTSSKNYLIQNLEDHEKIRGFSRWIYSRYCSLSGFLHLLPDFYILGAQKSGTTALFEYLTRHPNIPKTVKDIRFFDKYYNKGSNWYRLHFPLKSSKFLSQKIHSKKYVIGEATERYLEHPHAPKRLEKITPNAKFIIILRNPVERTFSHYNFNVIRKKENKSFENAIFDNYKKLKIEFEKMLNDENYYDDEYFRYAYLDRSIYVDKLKRWMNIFPREQFLIINNDDLANNTSTVYKKVLEFLKLPMIELSEYKKVFVTKNKSPVIDEQLKKKLKEFFKPHNEELYKLLGVNYDWDK